jgi:hypothetical protein
MIDCARLMSPLAGLNVRPNARLLNVRWRQFDRLGNHAHCRLHVHAAASPSLAGRGHLRGNCGPSSLGRLNPAPPKPGVNALSK